jgi:sortase (surface protein transpeptidase)
MSETQSMGTSEKTNILSHTIREVTQPFKDLGNKYFLPS